MYVPSKQRTARAKKYEIAVIERGRKRQTETEGQSGKERQLTDEDRVGQLKKANVNCAELKVTDDGSRRGKGKEKKKEKERERDR